MRYKNTIIRIDNLEELGEYLVTYQTRWENMAKRHCFAIAYSADQIVERAMTAFIEDAVRVFRYATGKPRTKNKVGKPIRFTRTEIIRGMMERIKLAKNEHIRETREGRVNKAGKILKRDLVGLDKLPDPKSEDSNTNDPLRKRMKKLLKKIKDQKVKRILELYYGEGKTKQEIADILGYKGRTGLHWYWTNHVIPVIQDLQRKACAY